MPRLTRLAATLLVACLPALVLVGAAEIVLRYSGAAERCPGYENNILWVCDPILYFKPNPGQIIHGQGLNRAGFRSREFTPKRPGVYRVLSLGDSCTFGVISPDEANGLGYIEAPYPQRLDQLAAARRGPDRIEVLNAAGPGYNSYQGIMLLRSKLRGLDPDLITVRFGWNDHFLSPEQHIGNAFHEPSGVALEVEDLLLRTKLYPFSRRLGMMLRARGAGTAPAALPTEWHPNVPLDEYRHNLRRFAELARARGAAIWFLTSPHAFLRDGDWPRYERLPPESAAKLTLGLNAIPSFQRLIEIHAQYNQAVREVGAALGVPVVDVAALYRANASDRLFSAGDVVHPTQEGHNLEAEALYAQLP